MTTTEALPEPVWLGDIPGYRQQHLIDYAARVSAAKDAAISALKEVRELHEAEIAAQDTEIERLRDALKGSLKEIEGEVIQYNLNAAQMPRLYTAMKIARESLKEPK